MAPNNIPVVPNSPGKPLLGEASVKQQSIPNRATATPIIDSRTDFVIDLIDFFIFLCFNWLVNTLLKKRLLIRQNIKTNQMKKIIEKHL